MLSRCSQPSCNKLFQVNRFDAAVSRQAAAGLITCPHCGAQTRADGASIYLAHALSTDEEAHLDAQTVFQDASYRPPHE